MHAIALLASLLLAVGTSPATDDKPSVTGGWTLNKELSDAPVDRSSRGDGGQGQGGQGRGGGRRGGGGGGGGGFGGGFGGRGRGGAGQDGGQSREDMARMRDAMRDLTEASDHLVVADTSSLIIITGADGRTTRFAPDGKKVKDENTGIERKTKWDGGHLVSEISGIGSIKATQTFAVDPETHRLHVTVLMQGGRSGQARTITHVYDPDAH
jgi:hypothetical protein